jgi:quinone-modifying oxidoreductase subunit QmoB
MGCAELKKMKIPAGNADTGKNRRILVVGGGIAGMTAALEAAQTGYDAILVEKESRLGGWAGKLAKRVPWKAPHAEPQDTGAPWWWSHTSAHYGAP